jgi:hypothetical protein
MAKTVRAKPAQAVSPVSDRERFPNPSFRLKVSGANENGKIRASSDFFAVRLRRALSARSAQRTCTKGALVHVAVFRAFRVKRQRDATEAPVKRE